MRNWKDCVGYDRRRRLEFDTGVLDEPGDSTDQLLVRAHTLRIHTRSVIIPMVVNQCKNTRIPYQIGACVHGGNAVNLASNHVVRWHQHPNWIHTLYWNWYIRIVRPRWVQMQLITENTHGVQQPRARLLYNHLPDRYTSMCQFVGQPRTRPLRIHVPG